MWIEDVNGKRLPPGEIGEIVAIGPKGHERLLEYA